MTRLEGVRGKEEIAMLAQQKHILTLKKPSQSKPPDSRSFSTSARPFRGAPGAHLDAASWISFHAVPLPCRPDPLRHDEASGGGGTGGGGG